MGFVKFGMLALTGLALAACQQEAGTDPTFPPIGGAQLPAMMPTQPTGAATPTSDTSSEQLASAVNDALAQTPPPPADTAAGPTPSGDGIASDDGVLVLAEQTQAEQKRLREADAAALVAAAARRVVIQPGQMPDVVAGVNIITYARQTTNAVGQRMYRRPTIRRSISASQCLKFSTVDDAQRNFLANGGPQDDPLNLDPDGDGFACRWSPEAYRALVLH